MRRVILGRVDRVSNGKFDPKYDIALGPWCFSGVEDFFPGWEELPFVDVLETGAKRLEAAMCLNSLIRHRIQTLADELNAQHGEAYSQEFWRQIIVNWLLAMAQMSYIRYLHIEKFVEAHSADTKLTIYIPTFEGSWSFDDIEDFESNGVYSDIFDSWLSGVIFLRLAPKHWTLRHVPLDIDEAILARRTSTPPHPGSFLKRTVRERLGRLSFSNVVGIGASQILFSFLVNLLPRHRPDELKEAERWTRPCDDPLQQLPPNFLDIFDELVRRTMPRAYSKYYPDLKAKSASQSFAPGRLLVGAIEYSNEQQKIAVALAKEAGERIIRVQHGGYYGASIVELDNNEFEFHDDAFLTWGWEQWVHSGRFVALPSPRLSAVRNRHRVRDDQLIFVGNLMELRTSQVGTSKPRPLYLLRYRQEKRVFIGGLRPDIRDATYYRPYLAVNTGLEDGNYIQRHFPSIPLLQVTDPWSALLRCKLMILDHPGTTLNIAMAANVPMICYWEDNAWPMCEQAQPYFNALRDNGVIFETAAEAASQANEIWDTVEHWWRNPVLQQARRDWAHKFARSSRFWWAHWAWALWKLSHKDFVSSDAAQPMAANPATKT